ncbi:MAG: DUF4012 domain-containing protein, partial [Frankiaceae bacterium]|nr:DUF4012 domain-containing protein [Frankiaceae bacterium]
AAGEARDLRQDAAQLKTQLAAGDFDPARATAQRIESRADRLSFLTSGPAWAITSRLPYAGAPLETMRGAAAAMSDLAHHGMTALTAAAQDLDPASLRQPDGSFAVDRILGAAPQITQAADALDAAARAVRALPAHTWSSTADRARSQLLDQLDSARGDADAARAAAQAAPALLGAQAPARYFLGFQNEAEARGTGGLPGSFAILEVDHGAFKFTQFQADSYLDGVDSGVDLGLPFYAAYGRYSSTSLLVNSNMSAHFPYAAQIWAGMWQAKTGQRIDAALAIDPTALGYLLKAAGPVTLDTGQAVTGDNVAELTQEGAYRQFPTDEVARKAFLTDLARTVSEHLLAPGTNPTALLRAAAHAVSERRILLWSADPGAQSAIEPFGLSGSIPQTDDPYSGFTVNNAGGNKLDYYLDRSIAWSANGCGPTRTVTATLTLTNNAPTSGLSNYVSGRLDNPPYPVARGDNLELVSYYATAGAVVKSVTVNGEPVPGVNSQQELGHPLIRFAVELPIGQQQQVVITLQEPNNGAAPHILRQPLVRPLDVTATLPTCG